MTPNALVRLRFHLDSPSLTLQRLLSLLRSSSALRMRA